MLLAREAFRGVSRRREDQVTWLWKVGAVQDNIISVTPVGGGWAVTSSLSDQPLMFLSGAQAETKARSLARVIAEAGGDAQVIVHDRRNVMIGAVRYFADDSAAADLKPSETPDPPTA